ncbi:hypothetical protein G7092_06710 [Mucilaginibacter sp. HC2]|uniref:RHS repeat-associated core domain-containing protein n=1 Tax=Mucilaginibacter inviolabilis TaxID=2714892 RepID=UPI0014074046|nr:RHS repeat-associated core domain-containing protein [Mucilaginibacter inviolabilis]NHA03475.1 hypothetical protein [Mucilaginibacter inviolabilis]
MGGIEWQNDFGNPPDYYQTFYRSYDAALDRWTGVDPIAESAESMTGYQYAGNSPMMNNDPMGNLLRQDDDSRISGPNAFSAQNQASSDAWIYGGGGDGGGGGSGWGSTGFGGIPINNGPMGTVIYDINQGIGTLGNAVAAINYITGQRVGSVQNVASTYAASMALAAGGNPGSTMLQK